jgi:hypothetical protein
MKARGEFMDRAFVQCAELDCLHLETRRIDDKWDWFVRDSSINTRIASWTAPSMEKAREEAEQIAGGKATWYCLPLGETSASVTR